MTSKLLAGTTAFAASTGTLAALLAAAGPAGATTLTVSSLDDTGVGTLRAALAAAADGDVIEFQAGLTGTISLASRLDIITDVTISGPGADVITIDGQNASRIFLVDGYATQNVTISGLTLRNAIEEDGGAVSFEGWTASADSLTITDVTFDGNRTTSGGSSNGYYGGAVFTRDIDTVTISGSTFTSNWSYYSGGAVAVYGGDTLTITDSTFTDNETMYDDGAAVFVKQVDTATISGSTFLRNEANHVGGAVHTENTDSVSIDDSTFIENTAERTGGVRVQDAFDLSVTNSLFERNGSANNAGALDIRGRFPTQAVVDGTTFDSNAAGGEGGAISVNGSVDLSLRHSVLSNNDAAGRGGGAIAVIAAPNLYATGSLTVADSTISGNHVQGDGGAIGVITFDIGPTDPVTTPPIDILMSTITGNRSETGGVGGVDVVELYGPPIADSVISPISLVGSIVSGNEGTDLDTTSVAITSDHSLLGVVTGPGVTDLGGTITSTDPGLAPLADNGGPTLTHALLETSVAIGAGPAVIPTFPGNDTDQRGAGFARVVGGVSDIGAFESPFAPDPAPEPDPVVPNFTG